MLKMIEKSIDALQEKFGFATSMLIFPMVIVVIYEISMRYVFNAPTTWGFEATTFLYGIHYMLGMGYTLKYNGHVKVDVFVSLMSQKKQTYVSLFTHIVFFLPVTILLTYASIKFAWTSILGLERSWTSWAPPIYPFKSLMALGFFLLAVQGISSICKDLQKLKSLSE